MSCDSDIIKIDLQVFKDRKEIKTENKAAALMKKKQEILCSNCFHVTYDHHHTHTHTHKTYNNNASAATTRQNRLYIITSDFTEDSKVKKQFVGYMNKLTENNKASLYQKIKELLATIENPICLQSIYDTVWDFIGKSPDKLYIYVLKMFDNDMTTKYIEKYIDCKSWYPPHYAFENNLLSADTESDQATYDMYCDYVKWKNTTTNHNKAILQLAKESGDMLTRLIQDMYALFEASIEALTPPNAHLAHFALEQIQLFVKDKSYNEVVNKLRYIDMDKLDSSSKFLILDILEL